MTTALADRDDNGLVTIIKNALIRGKSYVDIERSYGINALRAEGIMREYWKKRASALDPNEQRLLQLERLETLIEPLMDMASLGNVKSAEVLIKNLESINNLLGLNLQQSRMEIKVISDEQSVVVYRVVTATSNQLLSMVQDVLREDNQHALALIEDKWDEALAGSFESSAKNIIEAEVVEG